MSFARRSIISVAYHGVAAPSYQQCKVVVPVARREEQAEERRRKLRDEARRPFRRRARGQYRPEQGSWNFPFSYDFSYAYNRRISRSSPWRRISPGGVFREREREVYLLLHVACASRRSLRHGGPDRRLLISARRCS